MQVYDHESGNFICHNKYFGRQLTPETFTDIIEDFFKYNNSIANETGDNQSLPQLRTDVISKVISTVQDLIGVLAKLETYRFYTASLLVTYDGVKANEGNSKSQSPSYDVRMIDFAHSTNRSFRDEVVHEGPDQGFIQGLKSLVKILEQLMQKYAGLND